MLGQQWGDDDNNNNEDNDRISQRGGWQATHKHRCPTAVAHLCGGGPCWELTSVARTHGQQPAPELDEYQGDNFT